MSSAGKKNPKTKIKSWPHTQKDRVVICNIFSDSRCMQLLRGLVWVGFFPSFSGENAQTIVIIAMKCSFF